MKAHVSALRHAGILVVVATVTLAVAVSEPSTPTSTRPEPKLMDSLRGLIAKAFDNPSSSLTRKILEAGISSECSLGLFKLVRGIKRLEPWALRLIDSTGKYPTGFIQGTAADIGAFDECIETVALDEYGHEKIRGQYCVLQIKVGNDTSLIDGMLPAARMTHKRVDNFSTYWTDEAIPGICIGMCVTDDCSAEDLQKLARSVLPPGLKVVVKDCVTSRQVPLSRGETAVIGVLAVILILIVLSSLIDVYLSWKNPDKKINGSAVKVLTAFSAPKNTKYVFSIEDEKGRDGKAFGFMNGVRFISMAWILLGHCYAGFSEIFSRRINMIFFFDYVENLVVTVGFQSVDTFFFLSGFLLNYTLLKQRNNPVIVAIIAMVRRYIRTMVPLSFLIMCIYVLPAFVTGPGSTSYYDNFFAVMNKHWWAFLLQMWNFRHEVESIALIHLWYVSTDFQLFVVSLIVIQLFRKSKRWTAAVFLMLSLACCGASAWQVHTLGVPPFMVGMTEIFSTAQLTLRKYYALPFYHAVCFFTGCVTWLVVDSRGKRPISTVMQALLWCLGLGSGLCCVYLKAPWYQQRKPSTHIGELCFAFFDRILWSICVAWITFACCTKRGGVLNSFLSWKGFKPLSKLSFCVYFIHMPFYDLMNHIARERTFFSHFSLITQFFGVLVWSYILSYFMFIACEAPVGHIERLIFMPQRAEGTSNNEMTEPDIPSKETGHDNSGYEVYNIGLNVRYTTKKGVD